eukprot:gene24445-biopygen13446
MVGGGPSYPPCAPPGRIARGGGGVPPPPSSGSGRSVAPVRPHPPVRPPNGTGPRRADGAGGNGGQPSFPTTVSGHPFLGPPFSQFLTPGWRTRCPGMWIRKNAANSAFDRDFTTSTRGFADFIVATRFQVSGPPPHAGKKHSVCGLTPPTPMNSGRGPGAGHTIGCEEAGAQNVGGVLNRVSERVRSELDRCGEISGSREVTGPPPSPLPSLSPSPSPAPPITTTTIVIAIAIAITVTTGLPSVFFSDSLLYLGRSQPWVGEAESDPTLERSPLQSRTGVRRGWRRTSKITETSTGEIVGWHFQKSAAPQHLESLGGYLELGRPPPPPLARGVVGVWVYVCVYTPLVNFGWPARVSGWVARCAGDGVGIFVIFPGRIPARESTPRAVRPPPPGARPGRAEGMGSEVGPAFQRRSRDTVPFLPGVRPGTVPPQRVLVTGKKNHRVMDRQGLLHTQEKRKGRHILTTGSVRPARHHGGHVKGIGTPAGLPIIPNQTAHAQCPPRGLILQIMVLFSKDRRPKLPNMLPKSTGSRTRFPLRNGVSELSEPAGRIAQELDFWGPWPGPGAWEAYKARAVPGTAQANAGLESGLGEMGMCSFCWSGGVDPHTGCFFPAFADAFSAPEVAFLRRLRRACFLSPYPKSKRAAGAGENVALGQLQPPHLRGVWQGRPLFCGHPTRYERFAPTGAAVAPCLLWFAGLFVPSCGAPPPHSYHRQVRYVVYPHGTPKGHPPGAQLRRHRRRRRQRAALSAQRTAPLARGAGVRRNTLLLVCIGFHRTLPRPHGAPRELHCAGHDAADSPTPPRHPTTSKPKKAVSLPGGTQRASG